MISYIPITIFVKEIKFSFSKLEIENVLLFSLDRCTLDFVTGILSRNLSMEGSKQ